MFTREMEVVREQIKSLIDLFPVLSSIEQEIESNPRNMDLFADMAFLCRKSKDMISLLEKKFNEIEGKVAESASDTFSHMSEKKYSTENCTISDNTDFDLKIPSSPSAEGFEEFIKQLPPNAVRPHYPTIRELTKEKIALGEQVPFGLPVYCLLAPNYKLRVTSKKEL